jgi:predicted TPR repeat methyltransferase
MAARAHGIWGLAERGHGRYAAVMTTETDDAQDPGETDPLAEAYNRGLALEKSGDHAGAARAYAEVLALDPADHGGASVRLAAMGQGAVPDKAPDAYVATLFDQCAAEFDAILVDQLGYAVPMLVRQRLGEIAPGPYARMLDLGCGTGLAGIALSDLAGEITGIDLAEGMVAEADERGVYDDLYIGEAVAFMAEAEEAPWDLLTATDVLPYLGDLAAFGSGLARAVAPGGIAAVSCETLPAGRIGPEGYTVGPRHRFAHTPDYLRATLAEAGFDVLEMDPITVRAEDGVPVPGLLAIARRL